MPLLPAWLDQVATGQAALAWAASCGQRVLVLALPGQEAQAWVASALALPVWAAQAWEVQAQVLPAWASLLLAHLAWALAWALN